MAIIVEGYILVPAARVPEIRAALPAHIAATLNEAGCLHFDVTEDISQQGRFNVSETFINQQAFEQHKSRIQTSDWGHISDGIPRHYHIKEDP